MNKRVFASFVLILHLTALLPASSFAESNTEITVSAALSLREAFEEIGRMYKVRNKGAKVRFNFGSSGDLRRQIEGEAPVDVFASAAPNEMDELEKKGLIVPGTRRNFAGNALVLLISSNTRSGARSFADLPLGDIKKIAVGNFKTVPAGRYAEEIFRHFGILPSIRDKLIFAVNVKQVLDYIERGEVDAGVVFTTDARERSKVVTIAAIAPEKSHSKVVYPIGVVTNSKNPRQANEFINIVRSAEGQKTLKKYGFKPAGRNKLDQNLKRPTI
jgi:molybdate transport system substrate-binding protein